MKGLSVFIFLVFATAQVFTKEYTIIQNKLNWFQAYADCANRGMQLASITSESEQSDYAAAVEKAGTTEWLWISGSDLGSKKKFVWMSTGADLTFTNWSASQPDNDGNRENCMGTWHGVEWNDFQCSREMFYVCERKPSCSLSGNIRLD